MNEINRQVSKARRRMLIGRFLNVLGWAVFGGLLLAVIGLAIPKIWHLSFLSTESNQLAWTWGLIGGGIGLGVLVSLLMTWFTSESRHLAAVEIDQRFGLKERISSAMSLDASTAGTEAGKALIDDASRRAETIDVRDRFGLKPTWRSMMPLIPALLLLVLMFVPFAAAGAGELTDAKKAEKEQIKVAIEQAKKRLMEKAKQMETKGLKDGKAKLDDLQKKIDDLAKTSEKDDKKNSLIKLNDIRKQVAERQNDISGAAELKKKLEKLQHVAKGPAKQMEEAMKSGDFDQAQKAIKELADKLKSGKLSDVEKKQLAKDLKDIADQMNKAAEKHEQDKKDLEEQVKKAQQEGDNQKAAQLQEQLQQMKKQDQQMQKMQQMAKNLQKAAKAMQPPQDGQKQGQNGQQQPQDGDPQDAMKQAQQALEDLEKEMQDLQQQMDEMKDLQDLADDLQECKECMQGNAEGEGQGNKGDQPQWRDWAKGEGKGGGKRDREEEETGGYKSKVKAKLQKGQTVIAGTADGANITGSTVTEARQIIESAMGEKSDPLQNQKLPKSLREHAQQYFQNLRDK